MKADNTLRCSRVARLRALVVVSIALAASAGVQAQVRKCQVDGRIVFQSAPCGPDHHIAPPAAVAVPAPVVTPVSTAADAGAAPKKRTLAELLRERDGADRPRAPLRETQHDGANVLRSRMGAV
jgi:hypothetical protein